MLDANAWRVASLCRRCWTCALRSIARNVERSFSYWSLFWLTAGLYPQSTPSGPQFFRPLGSLSDTGLLLAYAYPFICCGSLLSTIGSADRNLPDAESYNRAPRLVS